MTRTWIALLTYKVDRRTKTQTVTAGVPFGVCVPGETDPEKLEYLKAVKTCFIMHGFINVGWGGTIYRDWPVDGRVYRFYAQ